MKCILRKFAVFVDVWGNNVSTVWSSLTWTQFRFSFADLFLNLGQPCLVTAFKQHKLYNQASLGLREQIGEHSIIVESDYRNSRNKQTLLDSAAQKFETNLLTHSGETCRDFAVVWMCLNKDWSKTSWTRCSLQRWSFPGGTGIGRTHPKLQKPS